MDQNYNFLNDSIPASPKKDEPLIPLGEKWNYLVSKNEEKANILAGELSVQDVVNKKQGFDPNADKTEMPGVVRVKSESYTGVPVFEGQENKYDAALVIAGAGSTWHTLDKWIPDVKNSTNGNVYAYEGLAGVGTNPHNETYMEENIDAIANALEKIEQGGAKRVLLQTYSMGGVVGKAALHELEKRGSLKNFEHVEFVAIAPPYCGYSSADAIRQYMPDWMVDNIANPLLRAGGVAMSEDMGSQGHVFKTISQKLPDNVNFTIVRGIGDEITTPFEDKTREREKEIYSSANTVITALSGHVSGIDPKTYKEQGLNVYSGSNQHSKMALAGISEAKNNGFALNELGYPSFGNNKNRPIYANIPKIDVLGHRAETIKQSQPETENANEEYLKSFKTLNIADRLKNIAEPEVPKIRSSNSLGN